MLFRSHGKYLPDLSDPLTVMACLLLLREAAGDQRTYAAYVETGSNPKNINYSAHWVVFLRETWGSKVVGKGYTEAQAIVAALEHLAREQA